MLNEENSVKIICYDLVLSRLTKNDIELVRYWRNHPNIKSTMLYQNNISKEEQEHWFEKINTPLNYYFLITYKEEKIGLINAKNVNPTNASGEGGIFIWSEHYFGTPVPVLASVVFIDVVFNYLKISNQSSVTILSDNKNAINYNIALGYELNSINQINKTSSFVLHQTGFNKKLLAFKKWFKVFFKGEYKITIIGRSSNINLPTINEFLDKQL